MWIQCKLSVPLWFQESYKTGYSFCKNRFTCGVFAAVVGLCLSIKMAVVLYESHANWAQHSYFKIIMDLLHLKIDWLMRLTALTITGLQPTNVLINRRAISILTIRSPHHFFFLWKSKLFGVTNCQSTDCPYNYPSWQGLIMLQVSTFSTRKNNPYTEAEFEYRRLAYSLGSDHRRT
jgi:hypothetical protein